MQPVYSRGNCERRAAEVLVRWQRETNQALCFPIDVDLIGEILFQLTFDWTMIPEPEGAPIWARLTPEKRLIEMNERRKTELIGNAGLDRYSRAHELGHWELHAIQPCTSQLSLLEVDPTGETVFCRGRNDESWLEKHADWFAAGLLMPRDLFKDVARSLDLTSWPNVLKLKDLCDVSLTALCVRLEQCGCRWVNRDGVLHPH